MTQLILTTLLWTTDNIACVRLQGQAVSRKSVFASLDLDPHDFLVCLMTDFCLSATLPTASDHNI